MSGILSNLDFPTIMTWVFTVAIPTGIAILENYKKKGAKGAFKTLIDLMTEDKPMDEKQTALLKSGTVSDKTWKMSDETFERMCEALERRDVLINKQELRDIIKTAEEGGNVDYGIIICPRCYEEEWGNTHLYISYGTPMYMTKSEVEHNASVNHSEVFSISAYWYLTDLRKTLLLSEIQLGADTEKCVEEAIKKIDEEEQKQTEEYTLTCKNHYWIIKRGHVTERGTTAKKSA